MLPSVTYRHEVRVDTVCVLTCGHLVHSFVSSSCRFIGGVYGRIIGVALVDLHGGVPTDRFWEWIDPGALALIGAASFFGGVSRLTMSLTVIMVRIQHLFSYHNADGPNRCPQPSNSFGHTVYPAYAVNVNMHFNRNQSPRWATT